MTLDEVRAMSVHALKVKVAELCGWKHGPYESCKDIYEFCENAGLKPITGWSEWWLPPPSLEYRFTNSGKQDFNCVSDYPRDLNAMHDAPLIVSFTQKQWSLYAEWLLYFAGKNEGGAFEATAIQRARAFVLTMEPPE
jgi:hypothetical protein